MIKRLVTAQDCSTCAIFACAISLTPHLDIAGPLRSIIHAVELRIITAVRRGALAFAIVPTHHAAQVTDGAAISIVISEMPSRITRLGGDALAYLRGLDRHPDGSMSTNACSPDAALSRVHATRYQKQSVDVAFPANSQRVRRAPGLRESQLKQHQNIVWCQLGAGRRWNRSETLLLRACDRRIARYAVF